MRIDYSCETCGVDGFRYYPKDRVPNHFFCSKPCQNEWQKTREDLVIKNKDPEFRKKVSAGLKKRKRVLGDHYHSEETKRKIGKATSERWDSVKEKVLPVLRENARNLKVRTDYPYDFAWHKMSKALRKNHLCSRCLSNKKLVLHHIIPASKNGTNTLDNVAVLCHHCHPVVEKQQRVIFALVQDWEVVSLLVKDRLRRVKIIGNQTG